eukprot:767879-Hanusia_phi.AAC.1
MRLPEMLRERRRRASDATMLAMLATPWDPIWLFDRFRDSSAPPDRKADANAAAASPLILFMDRSSCFRLVLAPSPSAISLHPSLPKLLPDSDSDVRVSLAFSASARSRAHGRPMRFFLPFSMIPRSRVLRLELTLSDAKIALAPSDPISLELRMRLLIDPLTATTAASALAPSSLIGFPPRSTTLYLVCARSSSASAVAPQLPSPASLISSRLPCMLGTEVERKRSSRSSEGLTPRSSDLDAYTRITLTSSAESICHLVPTMVRLVACRKGYVLYRGASEAARVSWVLATCSSCSDFLGDSFSSSRVLVLGRKADCGRMERDFFIPLPAMLGGPGFAWLLSTMSLSLLSMGSREVFGRTTSSDLATRIEFLSLLPSWSCL